MVLHSILHLILLNLLHLYNFWQSSKVHLSISSYATNTHLNLTQQFWNLSIGFVTNCFFFFRARWHEITCWRWAKKRQFVMIVGGSYPSGQYDIPITRGTTRHFCQIETKHILQNYLLFSKFRVQRWYSAYTYWQQSCK